MRMPAQRLAVSLRRFLERQLGDNIGYGSNEEAALAAVRLLQARCEQQVSEDRDRYRQLETVLVELARSLRVENAAPDLAGMLDGLIAAIGAVDFDRRIEQVEDAEAAILADLGKLMTALWVASDIDPGERQGVALAVAAWDSKRISDRSGRDSDASPDAASAIGREKLEAYLRDRFAEPELEVTSFAAISGGFGKETIIFGAAGRALSGEFVLRRDRSRPLVDNDCHRVAQEFPVIHAVASQGFPAPDALWVDCDHCLLPGGDFIVMRRSPGATSGDIFGGRNALSGVIQREWAEAVAELHMLPPLKELGDLSDSIRTQLWDEPLQEVSRRYIRGYRDYYLENCTSRLPCLSALFGWLLANVPEGDIGRPVLVHGDLGLQNMLLDGDRLSAVLDWEMAHIGDPVEDLGYICNAAGGSIDWDGFLRSYGAVTGRSIASAHLQFYRVWGHVRNATAAIISADRYSSGEVDDFNLAPLGFFYISRFVDEAVRLIKAGPET